MDTKFIRFRIWIFSVRHYEISFLQKMEKDYCIFILDKTDEMKFYLFNFSRNAGNWNTN